MTEHEGAVGIEARPDGNGKMWISIDSLVDMFEDMANHMADGPAKKSMANLAATFRPMSTYAGMEEELADDGSSIIARPCETCQTVVIDGRRLGGQPIIVNAKPVDHGLWFPMKVTDGVPLIAPWGPELDGIGSIRLTEHECVATA